MRAARNKGMKIALYKESRTGETRVALTPDAVKTLVSDGWDVVVQRGAGQRAHFTDEAYTAVGATIADAPSGEVNLRVNPPNAEEAAALPEGSLHLSFLSPLLALDIVKILDDRRITVVSFDLVPRISRAQYMDCLLYTSGPRAVLDRLAHDRTADERGLRQRANLEDHPAAPVQDAVAGPLGDSPPPEREQRKSRSSIKGPLHGHCPTGWPTLTLFTSALRCRHIPDLQL